MDPGVRRDGRPNVDPDRGGVDEFHVLNPGGRHRLYVRREFATGQHRLKPWNQGFEHHRGFTRPRDPGDHCHPALWNRDMKGLHGVDREGIEGDLPFRKNLGLRDHRPDAALIGPGEERADFGIFVPGDLIHRSFRDHVAAFRPGDWSHLDHPVGFLQDLHIVINEHHAVPIVNQVVDDIREPHDIRGVKADRRFVQHIKHAGCPVPDRPRDLHPLPLAGGKRVSGSIERQVREPEVDKPRRDREERSADAFRHGAHFRWQ